LGSTQVKISSLSLILDACPLLSCLSTAGAKFEDPVPGRVSAIEELLFWNGSAGFTDNEEVLLKVLCCFPSLRSLTLKDRKSVACLIPVIRRLGKTGKALQRLSQLDIDVYELDLTPQSIQELVLALPRLEALALSFDSLRVVKQSLVHWLKDTRPLLRVSNLYDND